MKKTLWWAVLAAFLPATVYAQTPTPFRVSASGTLIPNKTGTLSGSIVLSIQPIYDAGMFDASAVDAGVTVDAGIAADSGQSVDSGVAPDAGAVIADGGTTPIDSGVSDASSLGVADPGLPFIAGTAPGGISIPTSPFTLPAPGATAIEPDMKTMIRRMPAGTVPIYAQSRAFTSDHQFIMLATPNVGYFIYRWSDLSKMGGGSWSDPKIVPGTHTVLHLDNQSGALSVLAYNIDTNTDAVVMTLPEFVGADGNNSFEDVSDDGRYFTIYGYKSDRSPWFTVIDLSAKKPLYELSEAALFATGAPCAGVTSDPDWFAVSHLSRYLVIQWKADGTTRCHGTEVWDLPTGTFLRNINDQHNHGDLAVDANGNDVYATVTTAYPLNNNYNGIVVHPLDGSPMRPVRVIDWGEFEHMSCRGPWGYCIVASNQSAAGATRPFSSEIWMVSLQDGSARHLAHHRTLGLDYWTQPEVTWSQDGKSAVVATDLGVTGTYESFSIELPWQTPSSGSLMLVYGATALAAGAAAVSAVARKLSRSKKESDSGSPSEK